MPGNKLVENMVLIARLPMEFRPVPICSYKDKTLGHIPCEWLGVAQVNQENLDEPEGFILYFLDESGVPSELLQYDTLQIAIDQARSIVGFLGEGWKRCNIPVAEDGSYNIDKLNDALNEDL
jgi:hypothetical protein